MKIHPIFEALSLAAMLVISSCISFDDHDDRPTTTRVTKETVVPDPLSAPTVIKTTETTTTTRSSY